MGFSFLISKVVILVFPAQPPFPPPVLMEQVSNDLTRMSKDQLYVLQSELLLFLKF